jgi:hypothetical protein
MTKGSIENCLSYVDQKYQADFLELMHNIEILISEEREKEQSIHKKIDLINIMACIQY